MNDFSKKGIRVGEKIPINFEMAAGNHVFGQAQDTLSTIFKIIIWYLCCLDDISYAS
ncbi:MAG: hypothetical protein ACU83U_11670 [Gammaproteobacteria bacterium]